MDQRSILITGCSSGIGRCLAPALQQRGYRVFASARRAADCEELRAQGVAAVELDLDHSDSIRRAFDCVLQQAGDSFYALVNNAAYGQPGAVEDLSRQALRAQFETNLFGTHELTRLAVAALRRRGGGRVIQISSILGLVCLPYRGAYNASKYALEALTDTLRLELRDSGIMLSLIEPGAIHSKFRANALTMLKQHIDIAGSPHHRAYNEVIRRLESAESGPMALGPEAVRDKVIHALESPRPRLRYRVTRPAQALALLKRLLPDRSFDWLIRRFAGR